MVEVEEEETEESEDDYYMSDADPEWSKTPMVRRKRANNVSGNRTSKSDISNHMDESQQQVSFNSTHSGTFRGATEATDKSKRKWKSKGCKCRGDCGNQRCGCNSLYQKCTLNCRCTDKCKNRGDESPPKDDSNESEGGSVVDVKVEAVTPKKNDSISDDENKINTLNKTNETDETYVTTKSTLNPSSFLTPKMARLSTFNFESARAKKKFFND